MTKTDRFEFLFKIVIMTGAAVAVVGLMRSFVSEDRFETARAEDRQLCQVGLQSVEARQIKGDKLIIDRLEGIDRKVDSVKDILIRWRDKK